MVLTTLEFSNLITDLSKLNIPKQLQVLFNRIKLEHYEELYEVESDDTVSLEDTLQEVLISLCDSNQTLTHLRYLWMTLILTIVVEPTLKYYQPKNLLPRNIINLIVIMINTIIKKSKNNNNKFPDFSTEKLQRSIVENNFYTEKEIANFQIIDEALDVFYNAIRVLDYDQSIEAMLNILEDCLEGYAIFPGSCGRRELFDWWLEDVVPASYKLLPPTTFYVVEGLANKEEVRFRQARFIHKISQDIRSHLQELILESKKHNNYISKISRKITIRSYNNSGKIKYKSKITQPAYS